LRGKAQLIGLLAALGAVVSGSLTSGLNLVVAAVLRDSVCASLLPCVADCCVSCCIICVRLSRLSVLLLLLLLLLPSPPPFIKLLCLLVAYCRARCSIAFSGGRSAVNEASLCTQSWSVGTSAFTVDFIPWLF